MLHAIKTVNWKKKQKNIMRMNFGQQEYSQHQKKKKKEKKDEIKRITSNSYTSKQNWITTIRLIKKKKKKKTAKNIPLLALSAWQRQDKRADGGMR